MQNRGFTTYEQKALVRGMKKQYHEEIPEWLMISFLLTLTAFCLLASFNTLNLGTVVYARGPQILHVYCGKAHKYVVAERDIVNSPEFDKLCN